MLFKTVDGNTVSTCQYFNVNTPGPSDIVIANCRYYCFIVCAESNYMAVIVVYY